MNLSRLLMVGTIMALLGASAATGQEKPRDFEKLGQVHFPVSCTAEAQKQFDRAVALLHSFWFDASAKGFAAVIQTDPGCAMAHWGIAMTLLGNPFAWPPAPKALEDGWAAVKKANAAEAKTARELDYIAALEAFYKDSDKVDHRTRALAYAKAMEQVYLRYPDDREAAVFYALALNATALPTDKTYANQLKAAGILEKVFAEQPNHPGAAHYLIHSYDYPPIASRGLSAARRYAGIAPSAPHALHMPAHIFTRQGFWQESIESNRASKAAATNHFDQLHAMDYLTYAYLQGAQDVAAKRVLDEMNTIGKVNMEHLVTAYALAAIPARFALERRRWTDAASLRLAEREFPWSRYPQAEALIYFARALGSARTRDTDAARKATEKLQSLRDDLVKANQTYWADQVEIQRRGAAAWLSRAEGRNDEALQLMRSAADLEDTTEKHPLTPGPIVPAHELLGDLLLELNRPGAALKEFETSFLKEPNRFHGIYGAARAAELSGDQQKARTYYAKLRALCEHFDSERPELQQAKAFLAKK